MKIRIILISALLFASFSFAGDIQSQRLGFINKLIDKGVFIKVEKPGSLPHVWVDGTFKRLAFADKQQFVSVVYAYYTTEDPKQNIVAIYDNYSGKVIGRYSKYGLKLD